MKLYRACHKQAQSGFAIILVMGLLLVAAAVTATLMARQENQTVWAPIEGTRDSMDAVSKAIAAYERKNHRLPLPALRASEAGLSLHTEATSLVTEEYLLPGKVGETIGAGATSYAGPGGVAYVSNNPTDANSVVLIGAIPTETLGLPHSAAEDSYGRLLTYAVTLASSNPFTYQASEGAITLQDNDGNEVADKLSYIVIAHGKEGAGAWNAKNRFQGRGCGGNMNSGGGAKDSGGIKGGGDVHEQLGGEVTTVDSGVLGSGNASGSVSDQANCDENDATFVVHDVTLVAGDGYFDDQLLRGKKDKVAQSISRPCAAQTVTWGKGGMCSATIPAPGLVHYASTLQPREIVLEHDGGATKEIDGCVKGKCDIKQSSEAEAQTELDIIGAGAGEVTGSVTVTCNDGELVLTNAICESAEVQSGCTTEDGRFLEEGQCMKRCSTKNCPAVMNDNIVCQNGEIVSWNLPCSEYVAESCTTPWGETVAVGGSVQAYTGADAGSKECALPMTHTCAAASKSGAPAFDPPMQAWSTNEDPCSKLSDCTAPWGETVKNGESVTAFSAPIPCPPKQTCTHAVSCSEEERTCINGTLSGSLASQQCGAAEELGASCTTPDGVTVADGESVTVFGDCDTSGKAPTCEAMARTCVNGSFDGSMKGVSETCSCEDDSLGTIEVPCTGKGCEDTGTPAETIDVDQSTQPAQKH